MPEDDLTIGEPDDDFDGENIVWDETTACQYVDTALGVLCALSELPDKTDRHEVEKKYLKQSEKYAIRIMRHYLHEIYKPIKPPKAKKSIEDEEDE